MNLAWHKWAALPLRLIIGVGFMYHGFPKLFSGAGHEGFVGMLQGYGIPAAGLLAWVVGLVEFVGGLMVLAGAFVMVVTVLQSIIMVVALFVVHLPNGFNFIHIVGMTDRGPQFGMPGYEVNLLYLAGLIALFLFGPSPLSVDEALASKRRGASPPPMP